MEGDLQDCQSVAVTCGNDGVSLTFYIQKCMSPRNFLLWWMVVRNGCKQQKSMISSAFLFLLLAVLAKDDMTTYEEHLLWMLWRFYIVCWISTFYHLVRLKMAGGKIPCRWQPEYLQRKMLPSLPVAVVCADPWNAEVSEIGWGLEFRMASQEETGKNAHIRLLQFRVSFKKNRSVIAPVWVRVEPVVNLSWVHVPCGWRIVLRATADWTLQNGC